MFQSFNFCRTILYFQIPAIGKPLIPLTYVLNRFLPYSIKFQCSACQTYHKFTVYCIVAK